MFINFMLSQRFVRKVYFVSLFYCCFLVVVVVCDGGGGGEWLSMIQRKSSSLLSILLYGFNGYCFTCTLVFKRSYTTFYSQLEKALCCQTKHALHRMCSTLLFGQSIQLSQQKNSEKTNNGKCYRKISSLKIQAAKDVRILYTFIV